MMIIRKSLLQHGRRLNSLRARAWTRPLTNEVELIEPSVDHSVEQTQSIGALLKDENSVSVPNIVSTRHPTLDSRSEEVVRKYNTLKHQQRTSGQFGSDLAPHYQPHTVLHNPPSPSDITLELLLASQAHLGHSTSLWNPMNSRYIFGIRQGIHIISLDVTAAHLRRACRVVSGVAERGGLILFVGTRAGQETCVLKAARLAKGCHLFQRWIPGSITNGELIYRACRVKLVDEYDREVKGFKEELMEQSALKPDLVVCLNPLENWVMLHECGLNNIPTVGIIDTDADPTWVTYPIPANDDSLRCIQLIAGVLGRAGEEGQAIRKEKALQGEVTYEATNFGGVTTKSAE